MTSLKLRLARASEFPRRSQGNPAPGLSALVLAWAMANHGLGPEMRDHFPRFHGSVVKLSTSYWLLPYYLKLTNVKRFWPSFEIPSLETRVYSVLLRRWPFSRRDSDLLRPKSRCPDWVIPNDNQKRITTQWVSFSIYESPSGASRLGFEIHCRVKFLTTNLNTAPR
ncbi:hypothetical protein C8R43DRAFT_486024 [Mycena crocata]|nr:hypothetical protein C8R43DRAFT_486024 [Mycena crocata]